MPAYHRLALPWDSQPQEVVEYASNVSRLSVGSSPHAGGGAIWTPFSGPTLTTNQTGIARVFTAASAQYMTAPVSVGQADVTLFAVARFRSGSANQSLINIAAGSGNQRSVLYVSATDLIAYFVGAGGSSAQAFGSFSGLTDWHVFVGRSTGGSNCAVFVDGVLINSTTFPAVPAAASAVSVGGLFVDGAPVAGFYTNSDVTAAGVLPYAATDAEIQRISRHLLGYLEYVAPQRIHIPVSAGGGGPTFIPAWARRQTRTIGAGVI